MIKTHPAYSQLVELAEKQKTSIHTGTSATIPQTCATVVAAVLMIMCCCCRCCCCCSSDSVLHDELAKLRKENGAESFTELTKDMHFYPDLHGTHPFLL